MKTEGAAKFLGFYLICGLVAGLAHIVFSAGSMIPTVGASGAISGVLGGYLMLFPNNRVNVLTRGGVAQVPAVVVLGLWIVVQLVSQVGAIVCRPHAPRDISAQLLRDWLAGRVRRNVPSMA